MDEAALRAKVGQLLSEVHRLPPGEAQNELPAATAFPSTGVREPSAIKREMAAMEENLDQVRLAIKYLVFDLEATQRENRMLRELLNE
jgi:hypothetical protein